MTILETVMTEPGELSRAAIALDDHYAAHNYSPLPVVAASAEGAWITDVEGRRYLDCLAAYSAVNFGHRNPEVTATAHAQLDTVTLVSRAFHSDRLGTLQQDAGRPNLQRAQELVDDTRSRLILNVSEELACEALAYRLEEALSKA